MIIRAGIFLALAMAFSSAYAGVENAIPVQGTQVSSERPALQSCPERNTDRLDVAQVSQTDCCKGHKGVCGCRAGKIVCCDGTASLDCTCHSDWGVDN